MSVAVRLSGLQEEMVGAGDAAWQREVEEAEGRVAAGRLSRRVGEAEMAAVGTKAGRSRGCQPRLAPMQGRPPTAKAPSLVRGRLAVARASLKGRLVAATRGDASEQKRRSWGQHPSVGTAGYDQPKGVVAVHEHSRLQCGAHKGGQLQGARQRRRRRGERGIRASFGEKDDPAPMNSKNFEGCPRIHNSHNTLNNSKNSKDCPLI
ncbi:hypothetical protein GW17_00048327 [Ensete ventricosum]|nr:hypothetical protein GW17_00048327 [Ensete ventricosum]